MEKRNNFEYDKELFKELPQFVKELHEVNIYMNFRQIIKLIN